MWNETTLNPLGSCRILQNPNNKKFSLKFLVVDEQLTPLTGAKAAQQMGLITVNTQNFKITKPPERPRAEVKSVQTTEEIIANYPEMFQRELRTLPGTVHLEVEQGATPAVAPPRRVPTSLKSKLKQELDRLQQLEVIASIDESTPWVSSLAVVKKSGALRICIDPRPLNASLKRERYQLPVLEDILPELSKARVFTTIDLKSGYWHCIQCPYYFCHSHEMLPAMHKAPGRFSRNTLIRRWKTCLESCALQTTFLTMGRVMPAKKPLQITIEISKTSYSDVYTAASSLALRRWNCDWKEFPSCVTSWRAQVWSLIRPR